MARSRPAVAELELRTQISPLSPCLYVFLCRGACQRHGAHAKPFDCPRLQATGAAGKRKASWKFNGVAPPVRRRHFLHRDGGWVGGGRGRSAWLGCGGGVVFFRGYICERTQPPCAVGYITSRRWLSSCE